MSRLRPIVVLFFGGVLLVTALALLPWYRNHHYLRDFYDYGLVMSAVGRTAAGEHAYVDFVTPIQTGIFIFNGWAEKLGGGTFQAMTWGAAVLIGLSVVLLSGIYARRWPRGAALALGGAVTWLTASQHTIIWHNTVGALGIAVVAWSAAAAPVLRAKDWGWHLVTALALVVGGITKLNSQLVALCAAAAWALWAGFSGRAHWPRVLATLGFIGCGGVMVPVALELAWTQAPLATWWYNVVELPFGHRTGDLAAMLQAKFYFTTHHGYYGKLPVPPLGAIGVAVTAAFAVAGVRALGRRHAGWVIAAAIYAAASGAALLATNYEIAYVAMGAWFALVAALWLGFGLPAQGRWFYGTLVAPTLLVGALAWQSAWVGQRSQFGYAKDPRRAYVDGGKTAPAFRYMRGTLLPPGMADSMEATADWHRHLPVTDRQMIFYGPGLEWLERVWPTLKLPGVPLWMHGGTSYGAREDFRLRDALAASGPYRYILVPEARDYWDAPITGVLAANYFRRRIGSVWFIYTKLPSGVVSWRPLDFLPAFGGNVNSTCLESAMPTLSLVDGRTFVGVNHGTGELELTVPSHRAQGEAVLRREEGSRGDPKAKVRFEVFSEAGGQAMLRWSTEIGLPAGEAERLVPFPIDAGGAPLRFRVTIPPALAHSVAAGWRALKILDSTDGPAVPGQLEPGSAEAVRLGVQARAQLLPADWHPEEVYGRNVRNGKHGLEMPPGAELWIRLQGAFRKIQGVAVIPDGRRAEVDPVVRVLYVKGAKLEVLDQSMVGGLERKYVFNAWSAEPDGWLVIVTGLAPQAPPVDVKIVAVEATK